jgi:hypothetical protein
MEYESMGQGVDGCVVSILLLPKLNVSHVPKLLCHHYSHHPYDVVHCIILSPAQSLILHM